MAKVTIKPTSFGRRAIIALKKSDFIAEQLKPLAQKVFDAAFEDPNDAYKESLQMGTFTTSGPEGRIGWQIGAEPVLGARVEAKRGTLQRALGQAGL